MGFQSLGLCSCPLCSGAPEEPQSSGDGLGGLTGAKPVWALDQIVDNLTRWDARWGPQPVPYTFYNSTPAHLANHPDWQGFVSFSPEQREAARLVMDLIADVANIQFFERQDDGTQPGPMNSRITFSASLSTEQHYTAYAGVKFAKTFELGDAHRITSAEQMYNAHRWNGSMEPGDRPFQVLIHEVLHAVGLPHPANYDASSKEVITYATHAVYAQDSRQFTTMSYFPASATGANHAGFPQTPMLHDVAALQALYGANTATRAGDTVYGYGSTAGRSMFDFAQNNRPVFTIWDAGGIDLLDFTNTNFAVKLDLNAGAFSDAFNMTNNISIAYGVVIEHANGGFAGDHLVGNAANNTLRGLAGDDFIEGGAGFDALFGDLGDDLIGGQDGGDYLSGGVGRDALYGDAGNDFLEGGADDDRQFGQDGDDLMGGQDGADYLSGGSGRDQLYGDAGADFLEGGADDDRQFGQDGDDLMGGQDGADYLSGGSGRDNLYGDAGNDFLEGGADDDRQFGQDGDDLMGGQDGADYLSGGNGRDQLYGDAGNDFLEGGSDDDRQFGQDGDDLMGGQDGADLLDGGAGLDSLFGDAGADTLFGAGGRDQLFGGAGADRFVFTALSDSAVGAGDRVGDFDRAAGDLIDLSAIDADVNAAGDQAFGFVGAFSGQAGQATLSFDAATNTSTLRLDINGDATADFELLISGDAGNGSQGFML